MAGDTYGLGGSGNTAADDGWGASYASAPGGTPSLYTAPKKQATSGSDFSSSQQFSYMSPETPRAGPTSTAAPTFPYQTSQTPNPPATTTPVDDVAHDQQARSIASSLEAAGHDVKWQGNQLMVDGRPYDVTGGIAPDMGPGKAVSPQQFIQQWQASHPVGEGMGGLAAAMKAAGYDVSPFMYGSTPSNNELSIGGQKTKVLGAEGTPGAYWYQPGMNDSGPGGGGGDMSGLVPSYAQVTGVGDHSALMPNIDMPDAPWAAAGGIPTYQPGAITFNDIPDFTPESLRAQMNAGGASSSLDRLVTGITDNPTSLDEHTVDTMKAQMKDTLAEQGQLGDEYTKGQAGVLGIGDSPWLASERAAARRSTGQAIAAGGQNIDIEAGKTRQAQKIASAGVGQSYQNARSQQVMDSVNAGLQRATVTGNRMALRESVAQAAAKSKQDAYQIQAQWLEAQTGHKISAAALRQQGQEFTENLMMQLAGMNVQNEQFGASYGLQAAGLQHQIDDSDWTHSYLDTQNLQPTQ